MSSNQSTVSTSNGHSLDIEDLMRTYDVDFSSDDFIITEESTAAKAESTNLLSATSRLLSILTDDVPCTKPSTVVNCQTVTPVPSKSALRQLLTDELQCD